MNKQIKIILMILLILFSQFIMAQQSPQEKIEQPRSASASSDIEAEKLNDLEVLTFEQFQYKYGYNSDTATEYLNFTLVNKVMPEVERKRREKEADLEAERAIDSILWVIGISFFITVFFIIKKYIPVFKVAIKQAAQKFQKSTSKIKGNLNESRLKRKVQDTVIKEVVKQKIRNKVGTKSNVHKHLDSKDAGSSSINLTKLKQDISIALENGEYDKAKELTNLAEKLSKLN
ncbi:hypothetical protein [Pseudoalteromonas sp. SCQQ13]|uniref:hypothetical protein n=1 Tax=Pseudoalteromonas sp. SCQQ13 TaxID=2792066 RepID=UPI0018CC824D|nr:hypothetical protein [Pseudoalteromonas sp. SCQQ13]MBH0092841.1 hypothetical protein [Pseudoalteromonas sp. SCQQ13]